MLPVVGTAMSSLLRFRWYLQGGGHRQGGCVCNARAPEGQWGGLYRQQDLCHPGGCLAFAGCCVSTPSF